MDIGFLKGVLDRVRKDPEYFISPCGYCDMHTLIKEDVPSRCDMCLYNEYNNMFTSRVCPSFIDIESSVK